MQRLALIAVLALLGCGPDQPVSADASIAGDASARPDGGAADAHVGPDATSSFALGQSCTGAGQGDCPAGFFCAELQGFAGRWCTRECVGRDDPSCPTGYDGPGFPACRLNLSVPGTGATGTVCLIVCDGNSTDCPGGACDGTCPVGLTCTATGAPSGYSACL